MSWRVRRWRASNRRKMAAYPSGATAVVDLARENCPSTTPANRGHVAALLHRRRPSVCLYTRSGVRRAEPRTTRSQHTKQFGIPIASSHQSSRLQLWMQPLVPRGIGDDFPHRLAGRLWAVSVPGLRSSVALAVASRRTIEVVARRWRSRSEQSAQWLHRCSRRWSLDETISRRRHAGARPQRRGRNGRNGSPRTVRRDLPH